MVSHTYLTQLELKMVCFVESVDVMTGSSRQRLRIILVSSGVQLSELFFSLDWVIHQIMHTLLSVTICLVANESACDSSQSYEIPAQLSPREHQPITIWIVRTSLREPCIIQLVQKDKLEQFNVISQRWLCFMSNDQRYNINISPEQFCDKDCKLLEPAFYRIINGASGLGLRFNDIEYKYHVINNGLQRSRTGVQLHHQRCLCYSSNGQRYNIQITDDKLYDKDCKVFEPAFDHIINGACASGIMINVIKKAFVWPILWQRQ